MPINKMISKTLKLLSTPDIQMKKNYKIVRKVINITNFHFRKPFYQIWDYQVTCKDHKVPVRIFSPDKKGPHPIIIFYHGGGFVTGSINSYNRICCHMAKQTNHIIISIDYRLAPEHPFPAAIEDCYTATKEIFLHPELFQITSDNITLVGDSAGGNLAAVISLIAEERKEFYPQRQILFYPLTTSDHSEDCPYPSVRDNGQDYLLTTKRIEDYMDLYAPNKVTRESHYIAPIKATLCKRQPKTLIFTAEFDPLRDEGEAYGKKLELEGNQVEIHRMKDTIHGFLSLSANSTTIKNTYQIINKFLKEGEGTNEKKN